MIPCVIGHFPGIATVPTSKVQYTSYLDATPKRTSTAA